MSERTGKKTQLPLSKCREYFTYDSQKGELTARVNSPRRLAGEPIDPAPDPRGRAKRVSVEGRPYTMASICYALYYGHEPGGRISFLDGDKTNMRPGNLIVKEMRSHARSPLRERVRAAVLTYRTVKPEAALPRAKELMDWYGHYERLVTDVPIDLQEEREAFREAYPDEDLLPPRELWVWSRVCAWLQP